MDNVNVIFNKIKSMSPYNPLMGLFINYLKLTINDADLAVSDKEAMLKEVESHVKQTDEIDEFSLACIKRYFSQEQMIYMNIPYCRYLEDRLNMMKFYKESGSNEYVIESYNYEKGMQDLVELFSKLSEDAWWVLTWLEEYVIIAKKLEIIDFKKDENIDIFFQVKEKVLKLERDTMVKLNVGDLMNAFEDDSVGAGKLKAEKFMILKKFLLDEDLTQEIKNLNSKCVDNNSLMKQLELRKYIEDLKSPINPYKYLGLYKSDNKWLNVFPEELIADIRKLITDIFKQPDAETLANGLAEYLIIKDLSEGNEPNIEAISKSIFPFYVSKDDIWTKIKFFTDVIKFTGKGDSNEESYDDQKICDL